MHSDAIAAHFQTDGQQKFVSRTTIGAVTGATKMVAVDAAVDWAPALIKAPRCRAL